MNMLIQGDNLTGLLELQKKYKSKIRLIYIDPPFSTKKIFRVSKDRTSTISMSGDSIAYKDVLTGTAYLLALKKRLELAYVLLSDDGSIYVHIDCKIAYDVKNILDDIFGIDNFRNSISRIKSNPKNFTQKGYGSMKDTILFYTKSNKFVWNEPRVKPSQERLDQFTKSDQCGKYTTAPIHAPGETKNGDTGKRWHGKSPPIGRHWRYSPKQLTKLEKKGKIEWSSTGNPRLKIYAKEVEKKGVLLQDIWEFKDPQTPTYPTEKNLAMLENIINTSSNPDDFVMDFYCGSGTALLASARNNRNFIGLDESVIAIKCTQKKLDGYKFKLKKLSESIMKKSMTSALDDIFTSVDTPKTTKELYVMVIKAGLEDSTKTRDSLRGILRNMKKAGKIKRVSSSTYCRIGIQTTA